MSTTDKLARALRDIVDMLRANPTNVQSREHIHLGIAANKALAEYDATPAVEVTADAVEVEIAEQLERWLELGGVMDTTLRINLAKWSKHLRALAAAFPALVQQVEDMKESVHHWRRQYNIECGNLTKVEAERDTLSAANARLAKDAERLDWLAANPRITEAHVNGKVEHAHAYVVVGHSSFTLREIIDAAATAQAKQAEGGE